MNDISELTQDHALKPVPKARTVSGWQIALVKIGVVIALPAFIIGAQVAQSAGFVTGSVAFMLGGFILAVLASLTGSIGARTGLSTALITRYSFGRRGASVVNLVLAITLVSFFGVTAELFGRTLNGTVIKVFSVDLGAAVYSIAGGVLMIATTIFGFLGLQRLANAAVPLLMLGIIWVCFMAVGQNGGVDQLFSLSNGDLSLGLAVSAVVGGMVVGATIFPDLCRFAHNSRHSKIAAVTTYFVAVPIILLFTTIPSLVTGEGDLMLIMLKLGVGLPALIFLLFTAWTTNAGNLYSSSLAVETLTPQFARWKVTVVIGSVGTAVAVMGITDYLIPLLIILGVSIPPIAGIYIADFYCIKQQNYDFDNKKDQPLVCWAAFVAWILATMIGYLASRDFISLSTIPACDSVISAFLIYYVQMKWIFKQEINCETPVITND